MIAMIGTSDRLCWLAETCKILLLLLQRREAHAKCSIELNPAVYIAQNTKTRTHKIVVLDGLILLCTMDSTKYNLRNPAVKRIMQVSPR